MALISPVLEIGLEALMEGLFVQSELWNRGS